MNENGIFRQKSVERVNSPEALNDYIIVAKPGIWILIAAVIILLAGALVFGIFGRIETRIEADVTVWGGNGYFISGETSEKNAVITVNGVECTVTSVTEASGKYRIEFSSEHLADGTYENADVLLESVSPISFIFN